MRSLRLALLLAVAAFGFLAYTAASVWAYPGGADACPADTILVMGAAQYDGRPSPVFERRLERALELYESGCAPRVLVTGGRKEGDRLTEGEAGAAFLRKRGVPDGALAVETSSRTSYENLRNSLPIVGTGRVAIVTDDLHAFRSVRLARDLGIDAEAVKVPTGGNLQYAAREFAAVLAHTFGLER